MRKEKTLPGAIPYLELEDAVIGVYAALDDALKYAGIQSLQGKLLARPGPAPEVDDREVLCLAVLQELLGYDSDHLFYQWFEHHPLMKQLFPRRLSRQNWADRRALLTPLIQRLTGTFVEMDEGIPPFS